MSLSKSAQQELASAQADREALLNDPIKAAAWKRFCQYLSPNATKRLIPAADKSARLAADGFGTLQDDGTIPHFEDMLYDWSHVRDSSTAALMEVNRRIGYALSCGLTAK